LKNLQFLLQIGHEKKTEAKKFVKAKIQIQILQQYEKNKTDLKYIFY